MDMKPGKRSLAIVGAAGTVGSILVERYVKDGYKIYCVDTNETGLFYLKKQFGDSVKIFASDYATTFMAGVDEWQTCPVIHAAAYKHVGFCEHQPRSAAHNNINKLARFLNESRIKKGVYISTDKAVEPRCIMGMTKSIAEKMALEAGWNVVRFGNLWGSRGSVADVIVNLIENAGEGEVIELPLRGGSLTRRFIMSADDVYRLIKFAIEFDEGGPSIITPSELPEKSVRELISNTFNSVAEAYGRNDIKLKLSDAPLNFGEKHRESFLWPEELDYADESYKEGITVVPYKKLINYAY